MSLETLLPFAVGGAILFSALGAVSLFSNARSSADDRLDRLRDPRRRGDKQEKSRGAGFRNAAQRAAPALSKALTPKTDAEVSALRLRLVNAGFHSPAAPQLYLALKSAVALGGLAAGFVYGTANYGMTLNTAFSAIIVGGLAFYLPEGVLYFIVKSRKEQIFLGLPDVLDLLVVCVEAGLGLDAGMRRVAQELEDTHEAVCEEINICNKQLNLGSPRRQVLHDLGVRTGVDDMRALAAVLIQADKFGSSIGEALRTQSDSMRIKRRQLAEERAQQTAVKLIFPLVLFIFPGIFAVLVGPAALMIIDGVLV
ncbi:type II secretion system F family protein [Alienimonas californiensis]|uniref:Bacterial type II secretion system protein F domain protein n=1 Tax=Alienimonas californiensis TaxID=2527989 RepID=A0A517PDG6_9PLAN|nr:type II secretion system F family protein [Alienimonas californiensis]QDT17418.1 Bacterial type II secretion system protein F domain protein [Alienimonas californiensis]